MTLRGARASPLYFMSSALLRLYRLLQPVLGQPLRVLAHRLRHIVYGDTSELGESMAAYALVHPDDEHWIVEVGANDGITVANAPFFTRRGWNALLIEPNPTSYDKLVARTRPNPRIQTVQAACSSSPGTLRLRRFVGDDTGVLATLHPEAEGSRGGSDDVADEVSVRAERLDTLLSEHGVPAAFAVLSVDTEGHDLEVLRGLDFVRFAPGVIITETDDATEPEKHAYLQLHGYRLADRVGVNTLWQRMR